MTTTIAPFQDAAGWERSLYACASRDRGASKATIPARTWPGVCSA